MRDDKGTMNPEDPAGDVSPVEPLFSKPFALPAIVLMTAMCVGLTIVCSNVGYVVLFQNCYYLPIIITCICYPKRGLLFVTACAATYFFLLLGITQDVSLIVPALVRVVFFEVIGAFVVYLSLERQRAVERLNSQKQNLAAIVERQTAELSAELQQSVRLEKAYRDTSEYYERIFDRMHAPIIISNTELYITRTNKAFEDAIGKPKTELIGRKVLTVRPFDQLVAMEEGKTYVLDIPREGGKKTRMLWSLSEIRGEGTTTPAGYIATGLEIPEQQP